MVSGALLLDPSKEEVPGIFFRKRLKKVLPDFLLWCLIYFFLLHGNPLSVSRINDFFGSLFSWNIHYHLWFIYSILGFYLVVPLMRLYMKHVPRSHLLAWIVLWLIFYSLLHALKTLTKV